MEGLSKIGIDGWSVLLYLINYGVLLLILAKFVYPRILKAIDERRSLIANNLADADKLRVELAKQTVEAERERKLLMTKIEEETQMIKKELHQKRKEMLADMSAEREKMLEDTRKLIAEEKDLLIAQVQNNLVAVIKQAVLYIAMTKIPEEKIMESIKHSWKSIEQK